MSVTGTNITLTTRTDKGSALTHAELDANQTGLKEAVEGHSHDEFASKLGTDDNYMTDAEKTKLAGIEAGAEANVQADWNASTGDAAILNKPSIPSISGLLNEAAHDALDHSGLPGVPASYTLPVASTTVLGGIKVDGTTVSINNGVISAAGSLSNPMTAAGDLIIGGTAGAPARLPKGTDGQALILVAGAPAWGDASTGGEFLPPIAEYIVGAGTSSGITHYVGSGSAITTLNISGLDGDADGGYIIDIAIKNPGAASALKMFVNSDLVETNYNCKLLGVWETSTVYGSTINAPNVGITDASGENTHYVILSLTPSRFVHWMSDYIRSIGSGAIEAMRIQGAKNSALTGNLTQLDFVSAVVGAIGVGSTFRIYPRK